MATHNNLGDFGEKLAKRVLRKHFVNVRKLGGQLAFDYTGIDRVTGERVAIEVKTTRAHDSKLVHIEDDSMLRKLNFCSATNRKGVVLVIIKNGETTFHLCQLKAHISKGMLVQIA